MAPLTSALGARLATFDVREVETEIVIVPLRQRYFEAVAVAGFTRQLRRTPTANHLILYRITKS